MHFDGREMFRSWIRGNDLACHLFHTQLTTLFFGELVQREGLSYVHQLYILANSYK